MINLLPHQVAPAAKTLNILRARGAALDASDMGTGKTYMAAWCAEQLQLPVMVICPWAVVDAWEVALELAGVSFTVVNWEKLLPHVKGHADYGSWKKKITRKATDEVKERASFTWTWGLATPHLLIFDECHRAKAPQSKASAIMRSPGHPTLMLSATAASNPLDMKALGFRLGLFEQLKDHIWWCKDYGCVKGYWGKRSLEFPQGEANEGTKKARQIAAANEALERLHHTLFKVESPRGVRVQKDEIEGFPDNQVVCELVHPHIPKKWGWLNKAIDDAEVAIDEAISELEHNLRQREAIELSKLAHYIELTLDAVDQGMSVVLFVNATSSVQYLCRMLKDASWIDGSQTRDERKEHHHAFQDNETKIIVVQIKAGGVGIDLHDIYGGHPRMAIISPTYHAVELRQALGRIHRVGGLSKCYQRIICAAGTLEEEVYARVTSKLDCIDTLNDGDTQSPAETITQKPQEPNTMGVHAERLAELESQRAKQPPRPKARTARKAAVCPCGNHIAKGDTMYLAGDDIKTDPRCHSVACYRKALEAKAKGKVEVKPEDMLIAPGDLIVAAWGANPWEGKAIDTPFAFSTDHAVQLSNTVAGVQDMSWILDKLIETFQADPFDDHGSVTWTFNEVAAFIAHLRPEPDAPPAPKPPSGTPIEIVEGLQLNDGAKITWHYRNAWHTGTLVKVQKNGIMVQADEGDGRNKLLRQDDLPHLVDVGELQAPGAAPAVQGDLEYPVEEKPAAKPKAKPKGKRKQKAPKHKYVIVEPDAAAMADVIEPVIDEVDDSVDVRPPARLRRVEFEPALVTQELEMATVPLTDSDDEHHRYGPSSLLYREVCGGFAGNNTSNEAAYRGTLCHHACEVSEDFFEFPHSFEYEGVMVELNSFEQADVKQALKAVCDTMKKTATDWGVDFQGAQVHRELRLDVRGLTFGTADVVAAVSKYALMLDYKFGWLPVPDADTNPQGLAYAIGVFCMFPQVETVRVGFVQPKLGKVTLCDYSREYAMGEGVTRIAAVITRARAYDEGNAGEEVLQPTKHCSYCARVGICPALREKAFVLGTNYAAALPDVPEIADPATWQTGEQFAAGLQLAKVLEDWPGQVREAAKAAIRDAGLDIPGYELGERTESRTLKDLPGLFMFLKDNYNVTLEEFLAKCRIGIGDLQTCVKQHIPKGVTQKATFETLGQDLIDEGHVIGGTAKIQFLKNRNK